MTPSQNPVARAWRVRAADRGAMRAPVPFVIGVNRSGTTLLRMMLDSHPALAMPPETHFIPALEKHLDQVQEPEPEDVVEFLARHRRWGDFGISRADLCQRLEDAPAIEARFVLRSFYGLYAKAQGKERYGDKTPGYVKQMPVVQRCLPEVRFIHLIRDGRDVALSRDSRLAAEELSITRLAQIWQRRIRHARRDSKDVKHYIEVRYEDLVTQPEAELRKVCDFAKLDFDFGMMSYHERSGERLQEIARDLPEEEGGTLRPAEERLSAHSLVTEAPRQDRIGVWREKMPPEDVAEFEQKAGKMLERLGYPLSGDSP